MRSLRGLVVAVIVLALGGAFVVRFGDTDVLTRIGTYLSIAGSALAALAAIPTLLLPRRANAERVDEDIDAAVGRLARAVAKRLAAQREALGVDLLQVGWSATSDDVPEGDIQTAAGWFLQTEPRRLLILGRRGAGKSVYAMQMARDLLEHGAAATPCWVPIVVKAALWNPHQETFEKWLVRSLREEYPEIASQPAAGDVAGQLVDNMRVLPILDGLDELEPTLRVAALKRIDAVFTFSPLPLIVTSRPAEYDEAVAAGGPPMHNTRTVRLLPLQSPDIARYLGRNEPDLVWWRPVIDDIASHPDGIVATVLRSPLMVWAACRVHPRAGANSPDRMLAFTTVDDLERSLLDRVVDVILDSRDNRRGVMQWVPFSSRPSRRWLEHLAGHMNDRSGRTLAWWELGAQITRAPLAVAVSLIAGVALWLGLMVSPNAVELALGAPAGLLVGFGFVNAYRMQWASRQKEAVPGGFRKVPAFSWSLLRFIEALAVAVGACLFASILGFATGRGELQAPTGSALTSAFTAAAALALVTGFVVGTVAGFLLQRADGINDRVSTITAATPRETFRRDRKSTVVVGLMFFVATALIMLGCALIRQCSTGTVLVAGLGGGGVAAICALPMFFAWPLYKIRHAWLALLRRLPMRFMTFLDHVYEQGLFRQYGPHYEFRHEELRRHLTEGASSRR